METRKLRILCLHGIYNNIEVMQYQLDYYMYIFRDYIDFEIINAPFVYEHVFDPVVKEKFKGPFYGWYAIDFENKRRIKVIEGIEYLINYINDNGPFDGLLGFSQGSILARIILKREEFGSLLPKLTVDSPKFAILFSSVVSKLSTPTTKDKEFYDILTGKYEEPILFIYGEQEISEDTVSESIINTGNITTIVHNGGHYVPKFVNKEMSIFGNFIKDRYFELIGTNMDVDVDHIKEDFKEQYKLSKLKSKI